VAFRVKGKQIWKRFETRESAEDYLEEAMPDVRSKSFKKLRKGTFEEYIDTWKSIHLIVGSVNDAGQLEKKKLQPSTIRGYRTIIDAYLVPEFKNYPLCGIDSSM